MLLFCSGYEGFGMPPIEAMTCGCIPVLNSEVGAAELYARDGENSIFLNEHTDGMAIRLAALLDNPEKLALMRTDAAASVEAFNPEGYGRRLLAAAGAV